MLSSTSSNPQPGEPQSLPYLASFTDLPDNEDYAEKESEFDLAEFELVDDVTVDPSAGMIEFEHVRQNVEAVQQLDVFERWARCKLSQQASVTQSEAQQESVDFELVTMAHSAGMPAVPTVEAIKSALLARQRMMVDES